MRINAGKFKGKKLLENKYDHIRPTTDKVKQALFVKLQFFIVDAKVLDLFCGTGALGIEAISRGAKEVTFVDKNYKSVLLTKANLNSIAVKQKVYKLDALSFLNNCDEQYDLIILDPPYKSGLYEKVLIKIWEKNLLAQNGIIVCEHAKEDKFDYNNFHVFDEKRYGTIMLTYLKK